MSDVSARIERLQVYEVVVPAHPGAINSAELGNFLGHAWDTMPICILEAHLSDGVTALGEVGRGRHLSDIEAWAKQLPGVWFSGLSPLGLPDSWRSQGLWGGAIEERHPTSHWNSPSPLIGAFEMMLFDWLGKRTGCRMADLLGGAYRETVAVDYWCGRKTPQDLRQTVEKAVEGGFRGIKMKSRYGDPVLEQVRAIRTAGGEDFSITIDPMYQWFSPNESLATLKGLEQFGAGIRVEDPFPEDQPDFWRRARETTSVPLIWHARGLASLRRGLQERCADAFNISGGAHEFLTYAHALEVSGYSCWRGSSLELGIGQAAGLHAAAAARCCVMASDFQSGVIREHTLIDWAWNYHNGTLPLPVAAGLGVQLDRDALKRYLKAEASFEI